MEDYLANNSRRGAEKFKSIFHMRKELFLWIVHDMKRQHPYFRILWDGRGKMYFISLQKCMSAICQLVYRIVSDTYYEYLKMSIGTSCENLDMFYVDIIAMYWWEYLCKSLESNIQMLYTTHASRNGFFKKKILDSLNFVYWSWKKLPNNMTM